MLKRFFGKKKEDEQIFQFAEPQNTACFTCCHVLEEGKPILYVSHDEEDGMWQFLCGSSGHATEQARIVGLSEMVKIDPSINALYEMPLGIFAERPKVGAEWKVFRK